MKKAAFLIIAAIVVAPLVVLGGCGTKVPSVPSTVATVNGETIPSSLYLDTLSRRYGRDTLSNMIEQEIIIQWAKDEKVPPTEEQINNQIEALKRDGSYEDQVEFMGEEGLMMQLRALQARINLARKFTKKVDESELESMYDAMKSRYVRGPRKQVSLIMNTSKEDVQEAEKKLEDGEDFDDVAAQYTGGQFGFRGPIKFWIADDQEGVPPDLAKMAKDTKKDQTSKMFTIASEGQPTQYVIIKVLREQPKLDLKFKDVKEEVENTAYLQQSQMDPEFQKKLNERKKEAKIDIGIAEFEDLAATFQNPPEPPPTMMSPPQRSSETKPADEAEGEAPKTEEPPAKGE